MAQEQQQHPKNQSSPPPSRDLVKPGSTMAPGTGSVPPAQQGAPGQQGQQPWPQQALSEDDQKKLQERQQQAWDAAAEREKSNNPATAKQRQGYDPNAPGMHPANQPAPDTKMSKGTRLDLEDLTGNPGHRGVNPDAPANSINPAPDDKTGRVQSINEPSGVFQNPPPAGARNQPGVASINEPPGSQVIPPGAGAGTGEEQTSEDLSAVNQPGGPPQRSGNNWGRKTTRTTETTRG